jgi:hypothetical protein
VVHWRFVQFVPAAAGELITKQASKLVTVGPGKFCTRNTRFSV